MPSNTRFSDKPLDTSVLGESIKLPFSGLVAKNRFQKAAMSERLSSWDQYDPKKRGVPSPELIKLYEHWGKGQPGIILSGNVMVHPEHIEAPGNLIIEDNHDGRVKEFRELASAAKAHGSLFIGQISHPGRQVTSDIQPHPFSASDVQLEKASIGPGMKFAKPTPLNTDGIKEIVNRFATTAELLKEANFDGVELHGAHGYLIAQFLSRTTNRRTDNYGGSLENRSRIIFDIISEIRRRIPDPSFSISIKLNSVEFQEEGFETSECAQLCKNLEAAGIDFVDLSGGTYQELAFEHKKESTKKREAFFLEFADVVRPALSKTVIYVTGGFRSADAMVEAVQKGSTDGIGLGRPLTDDPRLCLRILNPEIPVYAARKPLDMGSQGAEVGAAGLQIKQLASDIEPSDLSDEQQVKAVIDTLMAGMKAQAEDAEKGIIKAGFPLVEGHTTPYIKNIAQIEPIRI
ncbi:NADH oxidase [Geopyxis carbonaria]|nr:NADH oxidase [Geopyxis carbonaria]